jgi:hypothetical protein
MGNKYCKDTYNDESKNTVANQESKIAYTDN